MAIEAQTLADSIPQLTFHNSLGLMQVQYGIPGLGIPAFDPSLPDSTLPSPEVAFADAIHLTPAGYLLFAEEAFDVFYEAQLVPEPVGDLNGDGLVNALDAGTMFANWGLVGLGYADGNIVSGGADTIDAVDAGVMFTNWTGDAGPLSAATAIPEPSSFALAAIGLVGIVYRRKNMA